jgi:glycosyltransferase involved in cell wall biosynthesis
VLPSSLESFGLPVLEAMACGTPSIVSKNAGVASMVRDGENGLLLSDPSSATELAAKLIAFFGDAARTQEMRHRARATAEQYSWDRIAEQFEAICEATLASRRAQGGALR